MKRKENHDMSDTPEHRHSGREPPEEPEAAAPEPEAAAPEPESPDKARIKKRKKVIKRAVRLLLKLGIVFLLGWLTLTFVFGIHRVSGNSMYPALRDGDLCFTYKIGASYAGDVVAYETPDGIRIGRIIAREGDEFDGDERGLIINGAPHAEEIFYPTQMLDTALTLPYKLNEGEYLILNDYRSDQSDSRTYGVIREEALRGKVIFMFRRRGF